MRINVVPKDGGNRFAGTFFAQGANGPLQADNRTDYVKQYLTVPPGIDYEYQLNPSYGGPIKRDYLWWYMSYRYNGYQRFLPGAGPFGAVEHGPLFHRGQGEVSLVEVELPLGRRLEDDVTDILLSVLLTKAPSGISDGVDHNDVPFLKTFPFS
jgi:hypothetical protein